MTNLLTTGLKRAATRKLQEAAIGFAGASALALLAEAGRRSFPSFKVPDYWMTEWGRYLGAKPGASKEMTGFYERNITLGTGPLVFRDGQHWFLALASMTTGKDGEDGKRVLRVFALTGGHASLRELHTRAEAFSAIKREPQLYTYLGGGSWMSSCMLRARPLSSVALPEGFADQALSDLQGFLDDYEWYAERHIPYRRGYLFHGPPGSGKTTLAGALAYELELNAYVLSLSDRNLDDSSFATAVNSVRRGVLILEDIDAMGGDTQKREGKDAKIPPSGLTLAGILNTLDGLSTASGLIVIMTTNHPERLDPALTRPGRVDLKLRIGLADRKQSHDLYARFFPEHAHLAGTFAENVGPEKVSPAVIQEHLLRHRHDPALAAQGIHGFI